MEKDRSSKVIAIVALLVAVVGLSLGFAAFSQTLTITPEASVKRDSSKFKVEFSNEAETTTTGSVTGVVEEDDPENATGGTATINELSVTNANAKFSKDGQTITYTWYVRNTGSIDAYLRGVTFTNTSASCEASGEGSDDANDALIEEACKHIKAEITVHGETFSNSQDSGFTDSTKYKIAAGTNTTIKLVITAETGATLTDSDYKATFGTITLDYKSNVES